MRVPADWAKAQNVPATRAKSEQGSKPRPTERTSQELRREGLHVVTRYEPKMNKVMRLHSVTDMIKDGYVHLPDEANWLPDYRHELTTFPRGRFDDQCDSTSQALDWVKTGRSMTILCDRIKSKQSRPSQNSTVNGWNHSPGPTVRAEKPVPRGLKCTVATAANAGIDPSGRTESRGRTCSKIDGGSNMPRGALGILGCFATVPDFACRSDKTPLN